MTGTLLHERHLLQREFDAQVATGHHEPVEDLKDLREVLDGLRLLDLGDDRQPDPDLVHDRVDVLDVGGRADERQRDHVGPQGQCPAQVGLVLIRQCGDAHGDAGQVDALVVRHRTALDDLGVDVGVGHLHGAQGDLAVVDEQQVTGVNVARHALVGRAHPRLIAGHVEGRDRETLAHLEDHWAVGEPTGADLRTLQVDKDPDGPPGLVGGLAYRPIDLLVRGVLPVGEVEPGYVHSREDKFPDPGWAGGGRAKSANDFSATHVEQP